MKVHKRISFIPTSNQKSKPVIIIGVFYCGIIAHLARIIIDSINMVVFYLEGSGSLLEVYLLPVLDQHDHEQDQHCQKKDTL